MLDEICAQQWTDEDISPLQTAFADHHRIPLLITANPRWCYLTGIVVGDTEPEPGSMPTESEITQIAARLEIYSARYHWPAFRAKMRAFAPYDIDEGATFGYFLKRPDGGWCYRRRTWENESPWTPHPLLEPAATLADVLERM